MARCWVRFWQGVLLARLVCVLVCLVVLVGVCVAGLLLRYAATDGLADLAEFLAMNAEDFE